MTTQYLNGATIKPLERAYPVILFAVVLAKDKPGGREGAGPGGQQSAQVNVPDEHETLRRGDAEKILRSVHQRRRMF